MDIKKKKGFKLVEGSEMFFVINRKAGGRASKLRTEGSIRVCVSSTSSAFHEDSIIVTACKGPPLRSIPTDTGEERTVRQGCPAHTQTAVVHLLLLPETLFL